MTINLGKLLSIFGKFAAALRTVGEAITPISHEVKGASASSEAAPVSANTPEVPASPA